MRNGKAKVAVVGGGVAGATIALYLSEIGQDVTLFEKSATLVSGPPMCHLHAGGNLYREISDEQCVTLLRESIDLIRFYPDAMDYRPTVIAVPTEDAGSPQELFRRLELLRSEYEELIGLDARNKVLGESRDYYKCYDRKEVKALKQRTPLEAPCSMDEWMIPVAQHIDLDKVQFPLIMVQEYGLNMFRLASSVSLALQEKENCRLLLNREVTHIEAPDDAHWSVTYLDEGHEKHEKFDFLINAAGFKTGELDDMMGYSRERFVEFKSAYVTRWEGCEACWPEVIFYGERGTPQGMAQFTPYPGGYFQLHGMTKNITLFNDGLVKSSQCSAQPQLKSKFLEKIEKGWDESDVQSRTKSAIEHLAQFIPSFAAAEVASRPLYGAQQIPGIDETLRAADVSFEGERYVRCEIVKASSVLSVADAITERLINLRYVESSMYGRRDFSTLHELNENAIAYHAMNITDVRNYPVALSRRMAAEHGCRKNAPALSLA
ncbi:MAG: FAD-dependent oxidoreductase [Sulfurimonadaceae bacterium]|nr:FAD-dependent oxidoreductase [Sulfurimonadaceae bacterium]